MLSGNGVNEYLRISLEFIGICIYIVQYVVECRIFNIVKPVKETRIFYNEQRLYIRHQIDSHQCLISIDLTRAGIYDRLEVIVDLILVENIIYDFSLFHLGLVESVRIHLLEVKLLTVLSGQSYAYDSFIISSCSRHAICSAVINFELSRALFKRIIIFINLGKELFYPCFHDV